MSPQSKGQAHFLLLCLHSNHFRIDWKVREKERLRERVCVCVCMTDGDREGREDTPEIEQ